jgi:hypothetical protein
MTTELNATKSPVDSTGNEASRPRRRRLWRDPWSIKLPSTRAEVAEVRARCRAERVPVGLAARMLLLAWARGEINLPI